jgi:hypothetical protein
VFVDGPLLLRTCFSSGFVIASLSVCTSIACDSQLALDQCAACSLLVGTWFNAGASFGRACFEPASRWVLTLVRCWCVAG